MPTIGLPPLAAAVFPWMNLVWVLVGITVFLFAVAGVGRWLAATHPDAPAKPVAPAGVPAAAPARAEAEAIAAAIAAAVHVTLGASAKVTSVTPVPPAVSVENLMLTWSLEGRRQIYTSHKVR